MYEEIIRIDRDGEQSISKVTIDVKATLALVAENEQLQQRIDEAEKYADTCDDSDMPICNATLTAILRGQA